MPEAPPLANGKLPIGFHRPDAMDEQVVEVHNLFAPLLGLVSGVEVRHRLGSERWRAADTSDFDAVGLGIEHAGFRPFDL